MILFVLLLMLPSFLPLVLGPDQKSANDVQGVGQLRTRSPQPYNYISLALLTTAADYMPPTVNRLTAYDSLHYQALCERLHGLNPPQKNICINNPFSIPFVSRGIRDAIYECQVQFRFERWNCSDRHEITNTSNGQFHDILGKTLRSTTKEGAFLAAITSAGVVHAVTRGCNTGNLSDCGCDSRPQQQKHIEMVEIGHSPSVPRPDHFSWGGCSDNVNHGIRYARKFMDEFESSEFERTRDVRHLVAKHNHFVGREEKRWAPQQNPLFPSKQHSMVTADTEHRVLIRNITNRFILSEAIAQNIRKQCRCHGVSGSCEFRTCWLQMPKMTDVAELLKKRYDNFAVQVTRRAKKRLRRKERTERQMVIRGNEMVFVQRSPTYCERNDTAGILGTHGRECVHSSLNSDSCDLLCCGRGHNTRIERRLSQCNCKFVWCCQVKCKECVDDISVHTCK